MIINKKLKEVFGVVAVIVVLIIAQRQLWVTNKLMVSHDSIIWYGIFSYFVDCLHQGFLPLWNPFMNCGEIFFLNINILHLLDITTLFLIFIGKFVKIDTLVLYHYDLLLRYIIFICGGYLFFRHVAKYKISAFIAFISLSFSSLAVSYLKQHAFILAFYLMPLILLSILKFLEQQKPKFFLSTVFLLGVALPSYHAMFIISSVSVLLMCIFLSRALPAPKFTMFLKNYKVCLGGFFIFILLTIRLLPVYLTYTHNVIPVVRIFEIPSGAYSLPTDFFSLLVPYSFMLHFSNWYSMSESFLYIGLIPLLFAIIGLCFSRHKYKLGFLFTAIIIELLMLGDGYPVYQLFTKFFPFFSIISNMHTFGVFYIFCLVFFTCIGADVVMDWLHTSKIGFYKMPIIFSVSFICLLSLLINNHLFNIFLPLLKICSLSASNSMFFIKGSIHTFFTIYFRSALNILIFVVGTVIIFPLLTRPRININIKYFVIIFFILIDLLMVNHTIYKFTTMPRDYTAFPSNSKIAYEDYRLPEFFPKPYPYAFGPAMRKIFNAYSIRIPRRSTHFYEMKDFYTFINSSRVSGEVKDIIMGISVPKLRLVRSAIVTSPNKIIEELQGMDANTLKDVVFIEEAIPFKYAHLKRDFGSLDSRGAPGGKIEVTTFNPNEIVIDVYADEDSFLYYSDGFDKGWRVFIDGNEGKVYKTNIAFKSVIIDKGSHIVRFVYDPRFYKFGLFCLLAGLLGSATIFSYWVFRWRRNS